MINHSRSIILEFLSEYQNLPIEQFTLVVLNKNYDNNLISKINNQDDIYIYHKKGNRVFTKNYDFSCLAKTYITSYMKIKEAVILDPLLLVEQGVEPYSLSNINYLMFSQVILVPIFTENDLMGFAILYLYQNIDIDLITKIKFNKLITKLEEDEIKSLENDIIFNIGINYTPFWIIEYDKEKYYLSKPLLTELKINQDELSFIEIQNFIKNNEMNIKPLFVYEKMPLFLVVKNNTNENDVILAPNMITNHPKFLRFSLLYFKYKAVDIDTFNEHLLLIKNNIKSFTSNIEYLIYKISEESFALLFNNYIDKRNIEKLITKLYDYRILYIKSHSDCLLNADLYPLLNYLEVTDDTIFDKKKYLNYRLQQADYSHKIKKIVNNKQSIQTIQIFNSQTNDIIGTFVNVDTTIIEGQYKNLLHYDSQKYVYNYLINDNEIKYPFIIIAYHTLERRQTWEYIKKLKQKYVTDFTLIIINLQDDYANIKKYIDRLNEDNIPFLFDKTILINIQLMALMKYAKGLYLNDQELMSIMNDDINLFQEIIYYYVKKDKIILINTPRAMINRFNHSSVYLICF